MYNQHKNIETLIWLHLEIITITDEIILEEMIEILSLVIDPNMDQTFQVMRVFREKYQGEIIIMPQS